MPETAQHWQKLLCSSFVCTLGDVSLNRALTDVCDAARRFGQRLKGFATLRLVGKRRKQTDIVSGHLVQPRRLCVTSWQFDNEELADPKLDATHANRPCYVASVRDIAGLSNSMRMYVAS